MQKATVTENSMLDATIVNPILQSVKPLKNNRDCEQVSILKVNSVHDVCEILKNIYDSTADFSLHSDSSIIIKPNLCAVKTPETGATTDVRVVEGIITFLKNQFGVSDISIVESDGTQVLADMAFKLLGYERLSRKHNLKLVNLSKSPFSVKEFSTNAFLRKIRIPKIIENADFFISVPKIKTHSDCSFTSALKNQYGCNPYSRKTVYHRRLHDAIVDFNHAFKPDLVVVDGIVAMEGNKGPTDGIPIKMNTIILGQDPVAVDHLVARTMGINPDNVRYLVEAKKRGLGRVDYDIVGTSIEEARMKFRTSPARWYNLYGLLQRDL